MRNAFLAVTVVAALVAGGLGGTFASFVDTEVSEDNFYQAGIADLLVNGKNDPDVPAKYHVEHGVPCKSIDLYIDLFNWGECEGGDVYMHFKNVVSTEDGRKLHMGDEWCYDKAPNDYVVCSAPEPLGPLFSSEPEACAEVGDCLIADYWIDAAHPGVLGQDYASGIADHLDVFVEVCDDGLDGVLDDCDDDGDGEISAAERAAHEWRPIPSLLGKLVEIKSRKDWLGYLETQKFGWIHMDVHLQQITDPNWDGTTCCDYDQDGDIDADDEQKKHWPTDAMQGDIATWTMLFELITDP